MRAHPGLPARPGQRGADPALQPDASRSPRRRAGKPALNGAYRRLSPPGTLPSNDGDRGLGRLGADRRYRRLHAAHLGGSRRPAPTARYRGRRTAGSGVRPCQRGPGRAGDLGQFRQDELGSPGLARRNNDHRGHRPGRLHRHPVDPVPGRRPPRRGGPQGGSQEGSKGGLGGWVPPKGGLGGWVPPGSGGSWGVTPPGRHLRLHLHRRDDRQPARRSVPGPASAPAQAGPPHPGGSRFRRADHVHAGRARRHQHAIRCSPRPTPDWEIY